MTLFTVGFFLISDFHTLIEIFRKIDDAFIKYTAAAYFIFQFHMIARLENIYSFQRADLSQNLEFPFALKSKMRWCKNVLEERDAIDQIILGAMDLPFCPILGIAAHQVHSIYSGGMASMDRKSLFCVKKEIISTLFWNIIESCSFTQKNWRQAWYSLREVEE